MIKLQTLNIPVIYSLHEVYLPVKVASKVRRLVSVCLGDNRAKYLVLLYILIAEQPCLVNDKMQNHTLCIFFHLFALF